jgi:hypothetical protein
MIYNLSQNWLFFDEDFTFFYRHFVYRRIGRIWLFLSFTRVVSGVFFFTSKLALKSELWTHQSSVCRAKTQITHKIRVAFTTTTTLRWHLKKHTIQYDNMRWPTIKKIKGSYGNSYLCIRPKKCIFFVRVWVF